MTDTDRQRPTLTDSGRQAVWHLRPDAAARLNVSERTIDRYCASGKLQRRRTDDGKVLVGIPEGFETASDYAETLTDTDRQRPTLIDIDGQRPTATDSDRLLAIIETQAQELRELREKWAEERRLYEESRVRTDTIIARLTQQLGEQRALPSRRWWQFWKR